MTSTRAFYFFLVFLFQIGLLLPVAGHAEVKKSLEENVSSKPIVIKSRTLEVDNAKKIATFTGDVNATKDDFVVDCQKMFVYYKSSPGEERKGEFSNGIDRIIATGQVRVTRKEGGLATAEKAVYFQDSEKIVLTGNPSVKQGNDVVRGDRIIIFLKENRTIVESTGKKRAQAIIFPKARKREAP